MFLVTFTASSKALRMKTGNAFLKASNDSIVRHTTVSWGLSPGDTHICMPLNSQPTKLWATEIDSNWTWLSNTFHVTFGYFSRWVFFTFVSSTVAMRDFEYKRVPVKTWVSQNGRPQGWDLLSFKVMKLQVLFTLPTSIYTLQNDDRHAELNNQKAVLFTVRSPPSSKDLWQ